MASSRLSHKEIQELKHDRFSEEVGGLLQWASENRGTVQAVGGAVILLVIIIGGYIYYSGAQAHNRAQALFDANFVADARVEGDGQPVGPNLLFPTQEERDAAVTEAYQKVIDEYPGSQEAAIAELYLAGQSSDRGDIDTAITHFRNVAENSPSEYASVARMSLAEALAGQGNVEEAEKVIQEDIDNPTAFVSKEEAQLTLGRILAKSDPERARKILEELQQGSATISRIAIQELTKLPAAPNITASTPEATTEQN